MTARDGEVCFGPAYNISNGGKKISKPEYLVTQVFAPLWGPLTRKRLRPRDDDSLHSLYGRLKDATVSAASWRHRSSPT